MGKKGVPPKEYRFKKGWKGGPGRPPDMLGRALRQLSQDEFRDIANMVIRGNFAEIQNIAKDKQAPVIRTLVAQALVGAYNRKEFGTFDQILNRIIGRVHTPVTIANPPNLGQAPQGKKTFAQFCEAAGYPPPYAVQQDMRFFGMGVAEPRLLLGARGYGKTDYVVILGIAYEIYCDVFDAINKFSSLIVTKSDERNAAILAEISKAAQANGVTFEKENSACLRVTGLHGKDHSVSAVTIGTNSLRGRHPKLVVMDDPVTEDDVSEATRKKVQRVYNEVIKLCPNVVVIGQPVHKQDLYERLRPLLKKMEVPHGSIPELDHDLEAQRLAGVSEESIQASYFLKVISENSAPLENIKFIDQYPAEGPSVAFIDPSFEGGDYTALTIVKGHFSGVVVQGRVWKRAWNHCLPDMVKEMVARGVKRVCFETNSLGDQPILMLRQMLPPGIGVVGKKSTNNKHSRIMNVGPFAEQIHLAKSSDRVYIEQVVMYEYGATHDDAPDSLASCLEWIGLIRGKKL